jgi:hypothetical protein
MSQVRPLCTASASKHAAPGLVDIVHGGIVALLGGGSHKFILSRLTSWRLYCYGLDPQIG